MFTKEELSIILQLVTQSTDPSSEGKIILGNLQAKIEAILTESQKKTSLDSRVPDSS